MALDPQVQAFLDQVAAMNLPPLNTLSVAEAREAAAALSEMHGAPEPVASVDNLGVPGPGGEIPVRVYTPEGSGPLPVLVYFHGGGWVIGDLETHDALCRTLANALSCAVVSVDYRLAPEHKFPAAAEDAYAATQWVAKNADQIGCDPRRIAVGGDSAGGNLAAVVTLLARDRGGPQLVFQLLICPLTDSSCDTVSCRENAEGYFLTLEMVRWFWNQYLSSDADRGNPYAAPLHAGDMRGLPPAMVLTAEFDPSRDEGEAYADRLRTDGVPVQLKRYDGMIHGFLRMGAMLDQARVAIEEVAANLQAAFAAPERQGRGNPLKKLFDSIRLSR
jgi:acetyl esterase